MKTPVGAVEKIAAAFIFLALAVLAAVLLFPGLVSGRVFNLFHLRIAAPDGIGLSVGDAVLIRGIQAGEVTGLGIDRSKEVIVDCKIYGPFRDRITEGTTAVLVPAPILGSPVVRLVPGDGPPLRPGAVLRAATESSLVDTVAAVSKDLRPLLAEVRDRVREAGEAVGALRRIAEAVDRGEGSAGLLVRDRRLYDDLARAAERLDRSIASLEPVEARVAAFSADLPALGDDLKASSAKLRAVLDQAEEGFRGFPALTSAVSSSVREARRVIESLERSFLIRSNLPRESASGPMAPSSYREAPSDP